MNPAIEKELREQLDLLPVAQQRQVLDFVRALAAKKGQAASGQALNRFAGTIFGGGQSESHLAAVRRATRA